MTLSVGKFRHLRGKIARRGSFSVLAGAGSPQTEPHRYTVRVDMVGAFATILRGLQQALAPQPVRRTDDIETA